MLSDSSTAIQIRIGKVSQLFSTLDPFPFYERDLDKDAEEFIVDWARELRTDHAIQIVIHLPTAEAATANAADLCVALNRYFDYRAGIASLDLNELFRVGRRSLAIGISVLAICLAANQLISDFRKASELIRFAEEGLIILGWVANWRPIEIFLYDWWPIVRRRSLYRRLARAAVTVQSEPVLPVS